MFVCVECVQAKVGQSRVGARVDYLVGQAPLSLSSMTWPHQLTALPPSSTLLQLYTLVHSSTTEFLLCVFRFSTVANVSSHRSHFVLHKSVAKTAKPALWVDN